ncbi:penicillin-binding protein [Virgibacillus halotolerans]|uniref:transglycosylase domain-containing protein n=1 Tax=Virgibacillus halotolerans TaxID=1071053 RepID=UPI001EF79158|nr:transglycosylase domain-containing protein [Virgibacillus halotolerans]MBM7597673.1 penicillin-binding protein [Virgibacillus halotolerans]
MWKKGSIQRSSRITYDVIWNVILFFLIIGFIGVFFVGGIGAGYFASLVKDEPIRSHNEMEKDIYNYEETSKIYFADNKLLGDIKSDLHREKVSLDDVSDKIVNGVIATEDQYFRKHKGVVPKAIVRAVLQEALNADVKTGGSTLTQQLIKIQILTDEVSFDRKAKEILLALRLEKIFDKDEILEAYLNIIPYGRDSSGRNIAGVQTAAKGIFGVDAKDVSLPQAAFLAGLPQSPSAYTPYINKGVLKDKDSLKRGINRMKFVLHRMYESGYVTKEEYEKAVDYDITADFKKQTKPPSEEYKYVTDEVERRAIDILTEELIKNDGKKLKDVKKEDKKAYKKQAERDLRQKGYEIHSTIDKKTYDAFQKVVKSYEHFGPDRTVMKKNNETGKMEEKVEPIQTGGILIENSTGRIISFVGGREYSQDTQFNHATRAKRDVGSTIKPLLDYAPAMEKGLLQPGSPIADIDRGDYTPQNYGGGSYGIVSARTALANSYNRPALAAYMKVINDNPAKEYLEKMGMSTLTEGDYVYPSLALGAMEKGVTVEENTNAFSTLGNNGKFVDAYMIDKITTKSGDVVYEHKTKATDVFTPQTTYLTIDMMRDVIKNGTGSYLTSQLNNNNVDWAGKTGTTDDYWDAWFIGTNPNVTFGTWIGYDTPHDIRYDGAALTYSQRNLKLWAELMNSAAEINPELVTPSNKFKRPDGIVERSYCGISGMLPSDLCKKAGLIKTDLFNEKYVPKKEDDSLIKGGSYVTINGKSVAAGSKTPEGFTEGNGLSFNPDFLKREGYDKLSDLSVLYPRTDREKWEKIGTSNKKNGNAIKDDGKAPDAPTSLKATSGKLTWNKSSSNDVVGYRVYRADKPGGKFNKISSTKNTSYSVDDGAYIIKSVDYFGRESKPSNEATMGKADKEDKDKDKQKGKEKKKDKDKKDKDGD